MLPSPSAPARVLTVTGSRADFGLLRPVLKAIEAHPALTSLLVVSGQHLIPPAHTYIDIRRHFALADAVPMQLAGRATRLDEAHALGVGIERFTRVFIRHAPDWVLVLGDRVEPFAVAASASVAGIPVAHIHGGDRAEGFADEALRHAITKLAHLHFPATPTSAERILRMGERPEHVHTVGSPAIDGLDEIPALAAPHLADLFPAAARPPVPPRAVMLLHPTGQPLQTEAAHAEALGRALADRFGQAVIALEPNHDPGREAIVPVLHRHARDAGWAVAAHIPRPQFVGLLRLVAGAGGVLAGNSSAGLIEAAALNLRVLNIGPRQSGREHAGNVVHLPQPDLTSTPAALDRALAIPDAHLISHPFGDGSTGTRIADRLARTDPADPALLRKRCTF